MVGSSKNEDHQRERGSNTSNEEEIDYGYDHDGTMNHDNSHQASSLNEDEDEEDQYYGDEEDFIEEVDEHKKKPRPMSRQLVKVNSVDDLFRLESENKQYDNGPSMQEMAELWLQQYQHARILSITDHFWQLFFLLQVINFILTFWGSAACSNLDTTTDTDNNNVQCRRWFWLLLHIPLDLLLTFGPAHLVQEKEHGVACMMGYTLALLYIILLDLPFLALAPDPLLNSSSSDAVISLESLMYLAVALLYGYADLGEGAQFQLVPLPSKVVDPSTRSSARSSGFGMNSNTNIDNSKQSNASSATSGGILKNPLPPQNDMNMNDDDNDDDEVMSFPNEQSTRWRVDLRGFSTRSYFWREFRGLRTRRVTNWGTLEYIAGDEFELKIHPIIAAPWRRSSEYYDDYGLPLNVTLREDSGSSGHYDHDYHYDGEEGVEDNRRRRLLLAQQNGENKHSSDNDDSYGSYPTFGSASGSQHHHRLPKQHPQQQQYYSEEESSAFYNTGSSNSSSFNTRDRRNGGGGGGGGSSVSTFNSHHDRKSMSQSQPYNTSPYRYNTDDEDRFQDEEQPLNRHTYHF